MKSTSHGSQLSAHSESPVSVLRQAVLVSVCVCRVCVAIVVQGVIALNNLRGRSVLLK